MTRMEIYSCSACGNIVEVMIVGGGTLTCCNQPMEKLTEQTADSATEKHVPVIEKTDAGILVKVGSVPHPMEEAHYIQMIELKSEDMICRKYLKPGDNAEAAFDCACENVGAREYCNKHGLWKS